MVRSSVICLNHFLLLLGIGAHTGGASGQHTAGDKSDVRGHQSCITCLHRKPATTRLRKLVSGTTGSSQALVCPPSPQKRPNLVLVKDQQGQRFTLIIGQNMYNMFIVGILRLSITRDRPPLTCLPYCKPKCALPVHSAMHTCTTTRHRMRHQRRDEGQVAPQYLDIEKGSLHYFSILDDTYNPRLILKRGY